ncbi:MAG: hypothetical protein QXQ86_04590 [Sulfolobales archaeon]
MNTKTVALLLALAIALAVYSVPTRGAVSYVVVIDLTHGQGVKGLDVFLKTMYDAEVYLIVPSKEFYDALTPQVKALVTGYYVGDLSKFKDPATGREYTLVSIYTDLLIIPQPTSPIKDAEVAAVVDYLKTRGGGLWVAGDSDYGAGEDVIKIVNDFMTAIGASIVLDHLSIADPVSNCGADYRVVALVEPPEDLGFLAYGAKKVLMHGPGVVAYYDRATGMMLPLTKVLGTRSDIKVIVWSSPNGTIVENNAKILGVAYEVGSVGRFPMVVAQIMPEYKNAIVVLSSETPIGGYQPMITAQYYLVYLDGPRFVRNVVLWASKYMGELSYVDKVDTRLSMLESDLAVVKDSISKTLTQLENSIKALEAGLKTEVDMINSRIAKVESGLTDLSTKLQQLATTATTLSQDLSGVRATVSSLSDNLSTTSTIAYVALAVAAIGLVISLVQLFRKR